MTYKMIDDVTLSNFRRFMASGIPLKEFGPQGAFDARARDQGEHPEEKGEEPEERGRPTYLDALHALKRKMSPEGFRSLLMAFLDDGEPAEDTELVAGKVNEPAMDSCTGKSHKGYYDRFPGAARLTSHPSHMSPSKQEPPAAKMSTADARGYASRFPDSVKIGRA